MCKNKHFAEYRKIYFPVFAKYRKIYFAVFAEYRKFSSQTPQQNAAKRHKISRKFFAANA